MDPCDLRLAMGDEAVRSLVDRRVPLFQFAIRSILAGYDLDSAEGRIAALKEAAPVVTRIKDPALRPEYTQLLAGWLGMDVEPVRRAVGQGRATQRPTEPVAEPAQGRPTPRGGPGLVIEREALKCALQQPAAVADWYESVEESAFTHPSALQVFRAIEAAGLPSAERSGLAWIDAVLAQCPDDEIRQLVRELAVEPLPAESGHDTRYATSVIARLLELDAARRVDDLRGRLQRADPVEQAEEYAQLFADLLALEDYRRSLRIDGLGER